MTEPPTAPGQLSSTTVTAPDEEGIGTSTGGTPSNGTGRPEPTPIARTAPEQPSIADGRVSSSVAASPDALNERRFIIGSGVSPSLELRRFLELRRISPATPTSRNRP